MEARERSGEVVELIEELALPLPAMVIGELLGIDDEDLGTFMQLVRAVVASFRGWGFARNLTWDLPRMVRFVDRVIARKRADPGEDLISALIEAEVDGERMTSDEVAGMVFALIIGGFETTTHLISSAIVLLDGHPEARAEVCADPGLLPGMIEEVMRYASPVYSTERMYPVEEVTMGGVTLTPKDMVLSCVGAANRDPEVFEDPDVFDIRRKPNRHLGFGMGAHYCVGASLARLGARVVRAVPRGRAHHVGGGAHAPTRGVSERVRVGAAQAEALNDLRACVEPPVVVFCGLIRAHDDQPSVCMRARAWLVFRLKDEEVRPLEGREPSTKGAAELVLDRNRSRHDEAFSEQPQVGRQARGDHG